MNKAPFATISLNFPVRLADRELSEITMRRPTLDDEIRYVPSSREPKKQLEEEARYFAHLCDLKTEEIRKLDMADYEEVQKQYLTFRGKAKAAAGSEDDGGDSQPSGTDAVE